MLRSQPIRAVALLTLILPLTACSVLTPSPGAIASRPRVSTPPAESPRRGRRSAKLSDGNIMAILVAANDAQVRYAELALAKSRNGEVRKLALMTKFDHESVNGAVRSLAAQLKVEPEATELSTSQGERAEAKRLAFRDMEGISFDTAYIANEVEFHRGLLRTIDEVLLPAVDDEEFRTLLTAVRPAMAAHLEHARVVAARIGVR